MERIWLAPLESPVQLHHYPITAVCPLSAAIKTNLQRHESSISLRQKPSIKHLASYQGREWSRLFIGMSVCSRPAMKSWLQSPAWRRSSMGVERLDWWDQIWCVLASCGSLIKTCRHATVGSARWETKLESERFIVQNRQIKMRMASSGGPFAWWGTSWILWETAHEGMVI